MTKRHSGRLSASGTSAGAKRQKSAAEHPFEMRLRAVVNAVDVANAMTAPLSLSIKNLLSVAAESFNCDHASVIVRDEDDGSLRFLCATGMVADELMQIKIPAGRGIAGFVFESGQPLVVGDTSHESSFYADIDRETGYSTQTLLATPLLAGGTTVGVLEFVNRIGEPPFQPFSTDEMDRAAHFAAAIAPLVAAHERAGLIETLFARAMAEALASESETQASGSSNLRQWLDNVRAAPEHRELLLIATLLGDIAVSGDSERRLCLGMLETLAAFIKQGTSADDNYIFLS
ncbi:MAG: GAF domain-containing protein [Acidobacteria bacterium]|nr:GAF domain-containing protein [Acidobacteriota bacterium]